jgi:putative transcription factor
MECELCASKVEEIYPVIFEGRKMYVCTACIKNHGLVRIKKRGEPYPEKRVSSKKEVYIKPAPKKIKRGILDLDDEYILKENYGLIIKNAREAIGLTQRDLAYKIKTKLSVIRRIESGKLVPSPDLVNKLEKALNVSLYEKASGIAEDYTAINNDVKIRLGDIIKESEE